MFYCELFVYAFLCAKRRYFIFIQDDNDVLNTNDGGVS